MQTPRNGITETIEQGQGAVAEAAQTVRDTAASLGSRAQQLAAEAGRQASAAAQTAYGTGNDMLDTVEGMARENIWPALLIAGAVGYGLACVVKNSR